MSNITEQVDTIFKQWDTPASPGCVLAVIKDGEIVYARGYGMADLERGVPITENSIFDIGSTGKQFTATAIAILANQGLINLDDSIRKHVPEMPDYTAQITTRHLIHHTSGLRDYLTLMHLRGLSFENIYTEDLLLDLIVHQRGLNFKPGSEYLYSNSGYFLLGIIAQRVTGKHITELIKEHIFDPLGMKNSTFNKDFRPIVKNRALSYDPGEKAGTFINALALSGGFGDGAILTNVKDLLLWDRNFYDNKLNNAQSDLIEQLHQTSTLNNGKPIAYAFGLFIDEYNGQRIVRHAGGWAGYRTELMRFPDQHFSVICISNLGNIEPTVLCQQVADIHLEDVFKKRAQKHRQLSISEMNELTGIYQGKYSTVEISIIEDQLHCFNGFDAIVLKPLGKKKFQLKDQFIFLSFTGRENSILNIFEPGENSVKHKFVQKNRFAPSSLDMYEGKYVSKDIETPYIITLQDNTLQLKRTPFDTLNPLIPFTENTFTSSIGELRMQNKNGAVKGFTLNIERVTNIKFKKVA